MSYEEKKIRLNNGTFIPCIGYGTSMIEGNECIEAIKTAINVGYTHIDTAHAYRNEIQIGQALKQSKISREKIFITSKVWKDSMGYRKTIESFNKTLKDLDIEYLDLFLIHWPKNNDDNLNIETWKALEDLYKSGKVKAIGVSNFLVNHLKTILNTCTIIPAVNQLEYHPGLIRKETIDFCREKGIVVEAWSPLGKGKVLDNNTLIEISNKYKKSVAQICLKWCLQNEIIPLPKSTDKERMKQNLELFDFELSFEDMEKINNLETFAESNMNPNEFN